jgi:hypothetical protein
MPHVHIADVKTKPNVHMKHLIHKRVCGMHSLYLYIIRNALGVSVCPYKFFVPSFVQQNAKFR